MGKPDLRPLSEWGHDAMWLDGLHHALHVALTGERQGYYEPFDGSLASVAAELGRPEGRADRRLRAEPRPGRQPRARRPAAVGAAARRGRGRALLAVHAAALPGRGVRRAGALPVLHRPHRPRDRTGDARGQAPRVRRLRGLPRRGARPAGSGHVRALEAAAARPRSALPRAAARPPRPPAASSRSRSTRSGGRSCSAAAARPCVPISRTSPSSSKLEGLAGKAVPARAAVGRAGDELLALQRERGEGRALPLRRRRSRDELRAHRAHGVPLARLPPGHRARPALRLSRARPLGAGAGAPLQPVQAADRPVREVDRGAGAVGARQRAPVRAERRATRTSSGTTRTTRPRSRSRS